MITTYVKANTEAEQRDIEKKLSQTGYTKTSDCMWTKIYTKGNNEIVVNREW
ncbi:MAG: hypothetical protein J6S14_22940 [Clostridia bacterium]|nr:hypothetical protein [Clostridia bacterium]